MNICSIEQCNEENHARSLCQKHYRRFQRNGFTNVNVMISKDTDLNEQEKFKRLYIINSFTGCWEWANSLNTGGYGRIMIKGKRIMAHVWSYILHKGEIPEELLVCHHCDNPSCVNPSHLFLGTRLDNNMDMINKKRHHKNTLNETKVYEIKNALVKGVSVNDLVEKYQVSSQCLYRIKTGRSWGHVA
jgi:HNH endonuclease